MLPDALINHMQAHLADNLGRETVINQIRSVRGGCINQSYVISTADAGDWFIKTNQARLLPMFEAECEGLEAMAATECFVIPRPVVTGECNGIAYLIMQHLEMSGSCPDVDLATRLARMHTHTQTQFGFNSDNFIGASPQYNDWHQNWYDFFMYQRLERQLKMLVDNGQGREIQGIWTALTQACDTLFSSHRPMASLLHGDLWMGNVSQTTDGCSIYDPACYYGDFEADLAMLELFGSLSSQFYHHYHQIMEKVPGSDLRMTWYNLYHIMNHANLFGGSYTNQALQMCHQLINRAQG